MRLRGRVRCGSGPGERPPGAMRIWMKVSALLAVLGAWGAGTGALIAQGPPVTPGFPNVPRTPGEILSGLNAPEQGRTAIIAYHNGVLFTVPEVPSSQPGADFQVRTWSLADPEAPQQLATWGTTPMPINAHGYFHTGEYLVLGANWPPEAPWSFRVGPAPGTVVRTTTPGLNCAGVRGCLFGPWFVGDTWWSYGEIEGDAWISRDGVTLGTWDHLGLTGVIGHPFLIGNLLIFASDQSRTGVATYDVSDPSDPVLLDVLTAGGPGGYWPEVWGGDGHLYVVFPYRTGGNGMRVVDVTDPTDLRLVADVPLPGAEAMYAQFQDEYAFIGDHKVDMRTFQSVLDLDGANVVRPNDGGVGIDTSQFALPLGNLLVTGGVGENEGMAIWAHQAEPDTRGPSVGYHIPRAGQTHYPTGAPITLLIHETLESFTIVNGTTFLVRPVGGSPISGRLSFSFDDVLTFVPDQPLAANTTYEVVLPQGGIKDAAGNGIAGYSFSFSTGGQVGGNRPPEVDSFSADPYPANPGAMVSFGAAATDPDGQAVQYRFDFGDGSPKSAWNGTGVASHSYAAAGHYRATVQARDPDGAVSTVSRVVTVVPPLPAGPAPGASSGMVCDDDAGRVWAVQSDHGRVSVLDSDTRALELEIAVCSDPRGLARTATGEIWVTCRGDDRLRVVSPAGVPVADIALPWGSAPAGVVTSPDGAAVFVALEGRREIRRFAAATRQQTGATALTAGPRALAMTADGGRLLATRFLSTRDRGEVWEIAPGSMALVRTIPLRKLGGEAHRDSTAEGRGTPNQLAAIVVSPDGQSAWVAGTKPNVERGPLYGPDLDSDNTVRAVLVQIDLGTNSVVRSIDLDNSDSPVALAFSPLGDYLFVALQGDDELVVLDSFELESTAGLGSLVTRLTTGSAPRGICFDAVSQQAFALNFLGRSATAYDLADFFAAGDVLVPAVEVAAVTDEPLPAAVLAGKRIFYFARDPRMSAEGYLSCATCHVDGGHDNRTWDFTGRGEGLRRTPSLLGRGGLAHGNVHWTANFNEIQDFEGDIRNFFGGTGFLSDADWQQTSDPLGPPKAGLSTELDALAAYVASLGETSLPRSPHREPDGSMTAEGQAGRALFSSLACSDCHRGSRFTDSTVGQGGPLHDVGTLRTTSGGRLGGPLEGIDTPTLRGTWNAGSWLHDGSAASLEEVFSVAGGEVIPAETGSPSSGAQIVDQYVDLNNDDTVRGRAYVSLASSGSRLTLTAVDGGSGGTGAIELRYSSSGATTATVEVNGTSFPASLPAVGNDPSWRHTNWRTVRVDGVNLLPGAANTIAITGTGSFPNLSLDEITVTTADELQLAAAHRQVVGLPAGERAALIAYLLQLDGQPESNPGQELFADSFESGNTGAWSAAQPWNGPAGRRGR